MAVALLVAAGRGERLGSDGPKAFVLCGGRPMLEWSIEALRAVPDIERIVVALPPGVTAPAGTVGVPGGEQRSQSVQAALRHTTPEDDDVVASAVVAKLLGQHSAGLPSVAEAPDVGLGLPAHRSSSPQRS